MNDNIKSIFGQTNSIGDLQVDTIEFNNSISGANGSTITATNILGTNAIFQNATIQNLAGGSIGNSQLILRQIETNNNVSTLIMSPSGSTGLAIQEGLIIGYNSLNKNGVINCFSDSLAPSNIAFNRYSNIYFNATTPQNFYFPSLGGTIALLSDIVNGPTGPTGPIGPTGIQGIQGVTGPTGFGVTGAIYLNSGANIANNNYITPNGTNANINFSNMVMPRVRTIFAMQVILNVAPGGVTARNFTLFKNGVDSGFSLTITGTALSGNITNAGISFVQNDTFAIRMTNTGAPSASGCAITLEYF